MTVRIDGLVNGRNDCEVGKETTTHALLEATFNQQIPLDHGQPNIEKPSRDSNETVSSEVQDGMLRV